MGKTSVRVVLMDISEEDPSSIEARPDNPYVAYNTPFKTAMFTSPFVLTSVSDDLTIRDLVLVSLFNEMYRYV